MTANKNLEKKLRRALNKAGYTLRKSRARINPDNLGGYMIVDMHINAVVAGSRYELNIGDVQTWVQDMC